MSAQYEHELDLAPMSTQTMERVGELLNACKKFRVDYATATHAERCFVEEYARCAYERKISPKNGQAAIRPFFNCPRDRS